MTRSVQKFVRLVALVGGLALVGLGLWALIGPRTFFDALAVFEPYNRHFLHDIGAFQIGLGAVLLLALWSSDALTVALAGVGLGLATHVVSHVLDRDIGGNPASDIPTFAILALLLLVAAWLRHRELASPSGKTFGSPGQGADGPTVPSEPSRRDS